jgi:Spy/CpxP family protein refolding chaperone
LKTQISSKLLAGFVVAMLVTVASAQPPDAPQPGLAGGPPADAPRWGRERIQTVIIGKFSSELNLTPEQAEKFFPRFKQLQNSVEDMQRAQHDRRQQLDDLSADPKADKSKVDELVSANTKAQEQMLKDKQDFLNDVSSFLTPQQVSKCSILMDELPQRIRHFIQERRGQGMGQGMGPGGPPDGRGPHGRRGY